MRFLKSLIKATPIAVLTSLNLTLTHLEPTDAAPLYLSLEQDNNAIVYLKTDSIKRTTSGYFYYKVYISFRTSNTSNSRSVSRETYEVFTSCNGNAYPHAFVAFDKKGQEIMKMNHVAQKIMNILRSGNPFDMTKVNEIEHYSSDNLISHILITLNTYHHGFREAYKKVCK